MLFSVALIVAHHKHFHRHRYDHWPVDVHHYHQQHRYHHHHGKCQCVAAFVFLVLFSLLIFIIMYLNSFMQLSVTFLTIAAISSDHIIWPQTQHVDPIPVSILGRRMPVYICSIFASSISYIISLIVTVCLSLMLIFKTTPIRVGSRSRDKSTLSNLPTTAASFHFVFFHALCPVCILSVTIPTNLRGKRSHPNHHIVLAVWIRLLSSHTPISVFILFQDTIWKPSFMLTHFSLRRRKPWHEDFSTCVYIFHTMIPRPTRVPLKHLPRHWSITISMIMWTVSHEQVLTGAKCKVSFFLRQLDIFVDWEMCACGSWRY